MITLCPAPLPALQRLARNSGAVLAVHYPHQPPPRASRPPLTSPKLSCERIDLRDSNGLPACSRVASLDLRISNSRTKGNIFMTDAQREASRQNGAKSHGPKTPEGKANASRNALRHGLTAKGTLLTNENPEVFQDHARAYYDKFERADNREANFVDAMPQSHWRQRRARSHRTH